MYGLNTFNLCDQTLRLNIFIKMNNKGHMFTGDFSEGFQIHSDHAVAYNYDIYYILNIRIHFLCSIFY